MTRSKLASIGLSLALVLVGCGKSTDVPIVESPDIGPSGKSETILAEPLAGEFNERISKIMNDLSARYRALEYDYNEELLETIDRVEARLAGKLAKLEPLPMGHLGEEEQLEHFREVFKQWTAKTGKALRPEIDRLKADVAARKPGGPAFHPEFQRNFAAVFDSLIPIEVTEMRERRNQALHAAAKPLLDEYRGKAPEAVGRAERMLSEPPYQLSPPASSAASDKPPA